MSRFKKIVGAILALWAIIMFVTTMLLFIIPIWLTGLFKEPQKTELFIKISRIWMAVFLPLTGIIMKIKGKEKFIAGQNYIVVCNHSSFMDVPVSSPGIPGPNKTIAKIEMSRIPLFGMIYKRGSVLVDRKNEKSRKDSINKMKEILEMGIHMCIYPEVTRNRSGKPLKEFHDGAFKLAVQTGKPIMPAIILNTSKVLSPKNVFQFWPHPISMHFLDPIFVNQTDDPQILKERVFQIMWEYIKTHQ
ncbi:MAG: 1-acyl-sn-glycerol-3-phosphate acyltransferase [Chitinophagaceae bacterium]